MSLDSIGVLVVDDHDIVRRGIVSALAPVVDIRILGEATCGEDAVRKARDLLPHVVLMDLRMPGMGGLEAARRIRIDRPATHVIAFTAWDAEPAQRLQRAGIVACVGKTADTAELEGVIRRVVAAPARGRATAGAVPMVALPNPFDALTSREMQIAVMLVEGRRAPEIARMLHIEPKTVHTYRYRIFEKLNVTGDVELTRRAAQHGLIGPDAGGA